MVWDLCLINQWNELLRFRVSKNLNVLIFFPPSEAPEIECLWIFHEEADNHSASFIFFFCFFIWNQAVLWSVLQFETVFCSLRERGKKTPTTHCSDSKYRRSDDDHFCSIHWHIAWKSFPQKLPVFSHQCSNQGIYCYNSHDIKFLKCFTLMTLVPLSWLISSTD